MSPLPDAVPLAETATPLAAAQACLDQLSRTLAIALSLVRAGRPVDLTGLDTEVGFVCARTLDLPPQDGRASRCALIELREQVDALWQALATLRRPPSA